MSHSATVVIPVHDGAKTLGEQLEALASQVDAPAFEIVVVLNRCTDSSREIAAAWTSRLDLSIVDADDKASAAYARNVGASSSQAPYLLFCDDDDRVSEQWVGEMLRPLVARIADVVGGCAVIDRKGLSEWMYDRYYARFIGAALIASDGKLYPIGASLGCTRSAFEAVGGYDESFAGAGCEDMDLTFRMLREGARIGVAPSAAFAYRPVTSFRGQLRRMSAYARGGALLDAKEGNIPPVPSYAALAKRTMKQVGSMAIREHEWQPMTYVLRVVPKWSRVRTARKVVREGRVSTPVPPEVNDAVAPVHTPIVGGLAFRAPRASVTWWAGGGIETRSLALIDALLGDGEVFVDCGANIGVFTVAAALRVGPSGRVYAFEPDPRSRALLEHNLQRHRVADRVLVSSSAVGAATGRSLFTQYETDLVSSFVAAPTAYKPGAIVGSIDAQIDALDDAIPGQANLIKVDVEGYEREVFDGAQQLLTRSPDAIALFEINPATLRNAGARPAEVLDRFRADRWALWLIDENVDEWEHCIQPLDRDPRMFESSAADDWYANVLAVPKHRQHEVEQVVAVAPYGSTHLSAECGFGSTVVTGGSAR